MTARSMLASGALFVAVAVALSANVPSMAGAQEPENPAATVAVDPPPEPEPVVTEVVAEAPLVVEAVRVSGGGFRAWFGLGSERRLEIVVRNPNEIDIGSLTTGFAWGRGPDPEHVVDVPVIGGIAAGESVTLRAPFRVDAPVFGSYEIEGVVGRGLGTTTFESTFSSWPWGLFVLGAALALWTLRRIVGWLAQRSAPAARRIESPSQRADRLAAALAEALDTHLTRRLDRSAGSTLDETERHHIAQDVGVAVVGDVSAEVDLRPAEITALASHTVEEIMLALEQLHAGDPSLVGQSGPTPVS